MFTYLHAYMPETWEAQEKAGFIDENSGIRFPQNLMQKESVSSENTQMTFQFLNDLKKLNS